eukprot:scaffold58016_cov33-Tisochrysis_lutea.AAC.1
MMSLQVPRLPLALSAVVEALASSTPPSSSPPLDVLCSHVGALFRLPHFRNRASPPALASASRASRRLVARKPRRRYSSGAPAARNSAPKRRQASASCRFATGAIGTSQRAPKYACKLRVDSCVRKLDDLILRVSVLAWSPRAESAESSIEHSSEQRSLRASPAGIGRKPRPQRGGLIRLRCQAQQQGKRGPTVKRKAAHGWYYAERRAVEHAWDELEG